MRQRASRQQHQQLGLALRADLGKYRFELAARGVDGDAQFIGRLLHITECGKPGGQPRLGGVSPYRAANRCVGSCRPLGLVSPNLK